VRLRDEPSISLSMLGWISVRAFVVSGGERCGRNLRGRQIRRERIWTAERLARALLARVRLRDEPSISLSMLGWSSVRAFFVSGGERGVDETSGLIRAIPGPHPSGHRRWRCSLRHPAFAVTNSSGTNLDSPRSLGAWREGEAQG